MCSSMTCPEGKVLRDSAEDIFCSSTTCLAEDEDRCCKDRPTCNNLECTGSYVRIWNSRDLKCKGAQCTVADDLDTCCTKKGFCDMYACPPNAEHKGNASEILCDDMMCA